MTYVFTIALGVITAATLSLSGGTPASILAELDSTAWPFVEDVNEFDLWADYGITLPDFEDGVYEVTYEITGESDSTGELLDFDYTTSESFVVDCEIACCISKMYAALDPDCSCSDKGQVSADKAYAFLKSAIYSAEYGSNDEAVEALAAAQKICDCGCTGC